MDVLKARKFMVIDFETTTPRGYAPEPIEVGAIAGSIERQATAVDWRFESFMSPPENAPLTWFDTQQTGISREDLTDAEPATVVLSRLDAFVSDQVLVAHNATVEAGVIFNYRESCPTLAGRDILCSWRLAKLLLPDLTSHRLDALVSEFAVAPRRDRHRALADVELTFEVLSHLLDELTQRSSFDQCHMPSKAIIPSRANQPTQPGLFEV